MAPLQTKGEGRHSIYHQYTKIIKSKKNTKNTKNAKKMVNTTTNIAIGSTRATTHAYTYIHTHNIRYITSSGICGEPECT